MSLASALSTITHIRHQHISFESPEELAAAMKRAAEAHHVYEETHGKDENWPEWYAEFISKEQYPTELPFDENCGGCY